MGFIKDMEVSIDSDPGYPKMDGNWVVFPHFFGNTYIYIYMGLMWGFHGETKYYTIEIHWSRWMLHWYPRVCLPVYPLVIKRGNGQTPINGGFSSETQLYINYINDWIFDHVWLPKENLQENPDLLCFSPSLPGLFGEHLNRKPIQQGCESSLPFTLFHTRNPWFFS